MKLGTFCGRLGVVAILSAAALVAATAATAGTGLGGVQVPTPSVPSVPSVPNVPNVPHVPAAPAAPAAPAVPGAPAVPAVKAPGVPSVGVPAAVTPAAKVLHLANGVVATALHGKPITLPKHKITVSAVMTVKVHIVHLKHGKAKTVATTSVRVNGHKVRLSGRKLSATPSCPADTTTDTTQNIHCVNQPMDTVLPNSCNADMVNVQGTFQYAIQATFDPVAMTLTQSERSNWQNVSGVVVDSGTPGRIGSKYQANDTEKAYSSQTPVGLAGVRIVNDHDENNELISLGPAPNQIVHMMTHSEVVVDSTGVHVSTPTLQGPGLKCTG